MADDHGTLCQREEAHRVARVAGAAPLAHPPARPPAQEGQRHPGAPAARGQPQLAAHRRAQLIDDVAGHTLAAASTLEADVRALEGDKKAKATKVGELIAARAREAGVTAVVFDRGGYVYHGRIAALADAAREGGLEF